ncbi:TPA: hemerythrin domain-containing protein [Vibrio parahaemolyticus]|nr:hemerythrin domain-containing protein [Vibrio parahaemolyticus]HAS7000805.1 hemerythrin domain-containing protein [Vibrio parahaemolyticus]HCE2904177.1 hemerythrin domain-containing protein [Vibrio parahaemolyticus]HCE4639890.1 hemerythrin domain-containing protein [Vibrio parahaemolyticus]HCH0318989.1 hemerythrin domain-containing protein [Vibrio parahaemolyticus]
MKNIFDVLKESHEKQRLLLDALMETSGDSPTRREFYRDLKHDLEQHAVAEERYFYAPLIESDKTIDMTRHGIAEHHAIDKVIAQLDDTAWSSPAWLTHMKTLRHKVLHHLEEEEQRFFQMAGKVMSDKQKQQLANDYIEEMAS